MTFQHNNSLEPISVYIHWPFCKSKCPYCDFNSHVAASIDYSTWQEAYLKEIDYFADTLKGKRIQSIFFGGGTPSLMSPKIIEAVISRLADYGKLDSEAEITLEANPTSSEAEKFKSFKQAGINRLSIGVQALNLKDLKLLGREHDQVQAIDTIEIAKGIFGNISFDLIYARPEQTIKEWQQELRRALEIAGNHISLYQLTIEKGTSFYKQYMEGSLQMPSSDLAASMYEWTNGFLSENGYLRYEISNYAKKGYECKHNLAYWHYDNYLGIGPGAHSRIRYKNYQDRNIQQALMMWHRPEKWLSEVSQKGVGFQNLTILNNEEVIEEILMMGLRLTEGLNIKKFENITNTKLTNILDKNNVLTFANQGLLEFDNVSLKLSGKGLLLHNYLVPRIIAE